MRAMAEHVKESQYQPDAVDDWYRDEESPSKRTDVSVEGQGQGQASYPDGSPGMTMLGAGENVNGQGFDSGNLSAGSPSA